MLRTIAFIFSLCIAGTATAQQVLDDDALSEVSGADGINFAMHLSINNPASTGPAPDSRISMGFNVGGRTTHLLIRNLRGTLDVFDLSLGVEKKPDGSDYVAVGLPAHVKYTDFGFESMSVQTDLAGPVTESLGRISVNGTVNMQGQLRMWAH